MALAASNVSDVSPFYSARKNAPERADVIASIARSATPRERGIDVALKRCSPRNWEVVVSYSPHLRYVDINHVESTAHDLAGFEVITLDGKKLGEFDGLIVDPPERQIRYLVVHRNGWFSGRRLLVPMSSARLAVDQRAVQVDLDADAECPSLEEQDLLPFSDEDLLAALFHRSASIH